LDGYIPIFNPKTSLIEAGEAIKRNELVLETPKSKDDTSNRVKKEKSSSKPSEKQKQSITKNM
jgi:hypothetical protein